MSAPAQPPDEGPTLDPQLSCTCCRNVLVRIPRTVFREDGSSWDVLMCPTCDVPGPMPK